MATRNKRSKLRKAFRKLQEECPKSIQLSGESVEITLAAPAEDGATQGPPTFEMLAHTGGIFRQKQFRDPVIMDLKGLNVPRQERPILLRHDSSAIVGHSTKITVSNEVKVAGVISGVGEAAEEVLATASNGFPWEASIGASIERIIRLSAGRKMTVNGRVVEGPLMVITKSRLNENSFVPNGADEGTWSAISAEDANNTLGVEEMNFSEWLQASGWDEATLSDPQKSTLEAAYTAENAIGDETQDAEKKIAAEAVAAELAAEAATKLEAEAATKLEAEATTEAEDVVGNIRAEAAAEVRRLATLAETCSGFPEIQASAIEGNWSAEKIELEVFKAKMPTAPNAHIVNKPASAATIEAALCIRAGLKEDDLVKDYGEAVVEAARKDANITLQEVCGDVIRASGRDPGRGFSDDTIRAALTADQYQIQAAGYSTVSLPGILGNVANKSLLAAYQAVPSVVKVFCSETSANDFKQTTSYRMTATGSFAPLGQHGELQHGSLTEDTYNNQVSTQGKIVSLSRAMLINDDLNAFLQLPRSLGRAAAIALEKSVFTLLIANTGSFFASGNSNLNASNPLSIDGLTAAQLAFRTQTDANGDLVMIEPSIMLVPSALSVKAKQFYLDQDISVTEQAIEDTATPSQQQTPFSNPFKGAYTPYASSYLDTLTNGSATSWYLFANPNDVPAIEIVYLKGKKVPTIERGDMDFNQLGIQYRSYFDWGVAFQDYRAASKNTA